MESLNFEFLRANYPELADLGAFAELYVGFDPSSAGVKLRAFAELLTGAIYQKYALPRPTENELVKLLTAPAFRSTVPIAIQNTLHGLRKEGNQAAHGGKIDALRANELLEDAFKVSRWWSITALGRTPATLPIYRGPRAETIRFSVSPRVGVPTEAPQVSPVEGGEVLSLLTHRPARPVRPLSPRVPDLSAQENELEQKISEAESNQRKYEPVDLAPERLAVIQQQGEKAANLLALSEAETRKRLVDRDLRRAGWNVGAEGADTAEVTQETVLANGERADYVLWDDNGKPLAVVEAKKTARSVEEGRKQAALYADALQAQYAQRPIIFTTNGHDIEIWDDRAFASGPGYAPRSIFGFYSKDSLQYRIYQRGARKTPSSVTIDPAITNRLYQIEAIRRVSERFTERHRRGLIVQATGTGKTRVAISLTDVLMRAGWARRILFLCDRTELRKQAKGAFGEFLKEPLIILDAGTKYDRNARIYLATYPALDGFFQGFDPGFFDLLIADESHRSVYNHYRDLFRYFDCLQIGLTATPVEFISRNSFQFFDCGNQDPTANYTLAARG